MLQIVVKGRELFDESTGRFTTVKDQVLQLEHSLVSISKWESKWKVPFLNKTDMTPEQTIDYIRCMTITQNVNPIVFNNLSEENMKAVSEYINDPMTATTIKQRPGAGRSRKIITSEVIYSWMVSLGIPVDPFQKWHFNRLMTLIRVCDETNQPQKKMSRSQAARQYSSLNAARRARSGSRG